MNNIAEEAKKALTDEQVVQGDSIAKKISVFKAVFLFLCYCYIGIITLYPLPYLGWIILALWIFFQHREMTKQFSFIEKEFSV